MVLQEMRGRTHRDPRDRHLIPVGKVFEVRIGHEAVFGLATISEECHMTAHEE